MSMPLAGTIAFGSGLGTTSPVEISRMRTQREQLTSALRTLAVELDGLDRRLADLEWRRRHGPIGAHVSSHDDRSALEAQRGQLASRLRVLARELNDIDAAVAPWTVHSPLTAPRVGTCPECGYPSLDSWLCAFCRPLTSEQLVSAHAGPIRSES